MVVVPLSPVNRCTMTTWIIRSETDDPKRALELFEDQRKRGYKVWIEDENGRNVDKQFVKESEVKRKERSRGDFIVGTLIWVVMAEIILGGLYALSFLAGD